MTARMRIEGFLASLPAAAMLVAAMLAAGMLAAAMLAAAMLAAGMLAAGSTGVAWAHCDTMSGPVITAARNALETGNVNLALIWVQPEDEALIRAEFGRALAARLTGGPAQETAEHHFFEVLVQVHRAGEGAPYTGIKPAGTDVGPAVTAADHALEAGSVEPVQAALVEVVRAGIERHFREVMRLKDFDSDHVAAGRDFVKAYVAFTHYAEGLYDQATSTGVCHEHGVDAHGEAHPVH